MNIIHDKNKFIPYKLLYSLSDYLCLSDVKVASKILNNLLKCYCMMAYFVGGDIGQAAAISCRATLYLCNLTLPGVKY